MAETTQTFLAIEIGTKSMVASINLLVSIDKTCLRVVSNPPSGVRLIALQIGCTYIEYYLETVTDIYFGLLPFGRSQEIAYNEIATFVKYSDRSHAQFFIFSGRNSIKVSG